MDKSITGTDIIEILHLGISDIAKFRGVRLFRGYQQYIPKLWGGMFLGYMIMKSQMMK